MTLNGLSAYNLLLCFTHNNAISAAFPFLDHKSWFFFFVSPLEFKFLLFICLGDVSVNKNYKRWYWTHKGSICVTIIFAASRKTPEDTTNRRHNIKRNQKSVRAWVCVVLFLGWSVRPEIWSVARHNNRKAIIIIIFGPDIAKHTNNKSIRQKGGQIIDSVTFPLHAWHVLFHAELQDDPLIINAKWFNESSWQPWRPWMWISPQNSDFIGAQGEHIKQLSSSMNIWGDVKCWKSKQTTNELIIKAPPDWNSIN